MSKIISNRYGTSNSKLMCAVILSSSMVLSGCGEVSKEERLAIADAASESEKYDDALIQLRSIVLSEPTDMASREKLAKVYFNIGNYPLLLGVNNFSLVLENNNNNSV